MGNITMTEKYALLCMAAYKKNLYDNELDAYLMISMAVRMIQDGNLELTGKDNVKLTGREPVQTYNRCLYQAIAEMDKMEISLKELIGELCFGLSHRQLHSIIDLLKATMLQKGLLFMDDKQAQEEVITDENMFGSLMEEIGTALLDSAPMADDTILLISLLNAGKALNNFSTEQRKEIQKEQAGVAKDAGIKEQFKAKQDALNNRLNEIENTETGKLVKAMRETIDYAGMMFR